MIAFAIVALCMLPLIVPNVWMITEEQSSIRDLEQERYANFIYAKIVEDLYKNQPSWSVLEQKQQSWTLPELPSEIPQDWPYTVQVLSEISGKKKNEGTGIDYHLLQLKILLQLLPDRKKVEEYTYLLFIEKKSSPKVNGGEEKESESEEEDIE